MKFEYKVKDVMDIDVVVVNPQNTIKDVSKKIIQEHASEAIVVENNTVKGIVTLRDLVESIADEIAPSEPVFRIMSTELITASEDDDLIEALKKMRKYEIGRLPVVDSNNNLVGLLSERTVVRTLPSILDVVYEEAEILEEETSEQEWQEGVCEVCGNYSEFLMEKDGKLICEDCWDEE